MECCALNAAAVGDEIGVGGDDTQQFLHLATVVDDEDHTAAAAGDDAHAGVVDYEHAYCAESGPEGGNAAVGHNEDCCCEHPSHRRRMDQQQQQPLLLKKRNQ